MRGRKLHSCFTFPRHYRRAGPASARRGFGVLGDYDLVVHVLVRHVELVDVVAATVV